MSTREDATETRPLTAPAPLAAAAPITTRTRSWGRPPRRRRDQTTYFLFLVPTIVLVGGLMLYPVVNGVLLSFHRSATFDLSHARFVGWDNYRRFFQYPDHTALIWHSFLRGVGGVVPSAVLGLLAALVLNQQRRLRRPLQVLTLVPFVISAPVSIFTWQLLVSPQFGIGEALGIHWSNPLISTTAVWPTLLLINTWASFPFYTIILLAALQRVPGELYDAAAADGASALRRFWHVTLPGIGTVFAASAVFHFMASFQDISLVYIATGGGPLGTTQTLSTYAYQNAFGTGFSLGYAAAVAMTSLVTMVVAVALGVGVGWLVLRVVRRARRRGAWAARPAAMPAWTRVRWRARRRPARWITLPRSVRTAGLTTLACLLAIVVLVPVLFIVSQSFDGRPPGAGAVRLWPQQPTLHNFVYVFTSPKFYHSSSTTQPALALNFLNSLAVAVGVTAIVLVAGSVAGYALARWIGWTSRGVSGVLLVIQFVPQVILVFPLYVLLARLGLLNSRPGLILATSAVSLPVAVLFFRVFFHNSTRELEEAASIDGAGRLRTFVSVVAPNSRAAFGAMGAFTLIGTWNEFVLAATLITDASKRTFPPALQQFTKLAFAYADKNNTPGVQSVYLLLPILTSALLLAFTARHFTAAVQGGGTKG